ncbi:unnamed protein product [Durusdinium trenchii]|uniref:Uncharacterized protein n=1 Tax=Durusdinium trenchii TaxID=1381693 RepID=A0ABP0QFF8_9DINO
MAAASPRVISGLKEVARLYRCVLFEASSLRLGGGLWGPCGAGAIRSAQELAKREKLVAAVTGNALPAKVQSAALREGGMPDTLASWSSGELVLRNFEGKQSAEALSSLPERPRIFETMPQSMAMV